MRHIPELVQSANEHLAVACPDLSLRVECRDGQTFSEEGITFDVIHCGAAVESVPQWMINSLAPGGKLVLPVGPTDCPQVLTVIHKKENNEVVYKELIHVLYVPLTSRDNQVHRGEEWEDTAGACQENAERFFQEKQARGSVSNLYETLTSICRRQ